jgi:hypothetical protein
MGADAAVPQKPARQSQLGSSQWGSAQWVLQCLQPPSLKAVPSEIMWEPLVGVFVGGCQPGLCKEGQKSGFLHENTKLEQLTTCVGSVQESHTDADSARKGCLEMGFLEHSALPSAPGAPCWG